MIDPRPIARALSLALVLSVAGLVGAQGSPSEYVFPRVRFKSEGVREVLGRLFAQVKKKFPKAVYAIDAGTMGAVTLNRKNVPLDTLLQEIARQIDATWQIEAGYVYRVSPRFAPRALPNFGQYRDEIKGRLQQLSTLPADPAKPRPPLDPGLRVTLLNERELNEIKARAAVLATNRYRVSSLVVKEIIEFKPELITVDVVVTYSKDKTKPIGYKDRWTLKGSGEWMLLWRREYVP